MNLLSIWALMHRRLLITYTFFLFLRCFAEVLFLAFQAPLFKLWKVYTLAHQPQFAFLMLYSNHFLSKTVHTRGAPPSFAVHTAGIWFNPDIGGIKVQNQEVKLSLYVDDDLLTLTSPHTILPNLHALLQNYSVLSGSKINMSKLKHSL